MGWGLRFSNTRYLFGSIENQGGSMFVSRKKDNDYWYAWTDSEAHMLSVMRSPTATAAPLIGRDDVGGYTFYKRQTVFDADSNAAEREAMDPRWNGYAVAVGNCLDNAVMIANRYGIDNGDWIRHSGIVSPVRYFNDFLDGIEQHTL
jgi:hypothetical protein